MIEVKQHQKIPTNRNERETLRNKGQFWTSAGIANPTAVEHFTTNNKKIQVAQYATGNQINGPGAPGFDPAFGMVPSRAIWLKKHIFKS